MGAAGVPEGVILLVRRLSRWRFWSVCVCSFVVGFGVGISLDGSKTTEPRLPLWETGARAVVELQSVGGSMCSPEVDSTNNVPVAGMEPPSNMHITQRYRRCRKFRGARCFLCRPGLRLPGAQRGWGSARLIGVDGGD